MRRKKGSRTGCPFSFPLTLIEEDLRFLAPLSGTKERDGAYTANKRNKNAENEARRKSECRHLRSLRSVRRVDVHQGCGENPGDAAEEAEEEEACLLPACKRTFHRHQHLVFPCILGIHLPNSFLFLRKTGARCLRPCSGTAPCRNLTILRALWHNLFRDAVK